MMEPPKPGDTREGGFVKAIRVPTTGTAPESGDVHVPERLVDDPSYWVTRAEVFAHPDNSGDIWIGRSNVSAVPGHTAPVELAAGEPFVIQSPVKVDAFGNTRPVNLYDWWISGTVDGDAVGVITW